MSGLSCEYAVEFQGLRNAPPGTETGHMKEGLQKFIGHFNGDFRCGGEYAGVPSERKKHLFWNGLIVVLVFCLEPIIGQLKFNCS